MSQTLNAIIRKASIRFDREVFLTMWIELSLGESTCQSFGGFIMGGDPDVNAGNHGLQPNFAGAAIAGLLRAAGVDSWDQLVGKAVRVKREDGFNGTIFAIGHIVEECRWFQPATEFPRLMKQREGGAA